MSRLSNYDVGGALKCETAPKRDNDPYPPGVSPAGRGSSIFPWLLICHRNPDLDRLPLLRRDLMRIRLA